MLLCWTSNTFDSGPSRVSELPETLNVPPLEFQTPPWKFVSTVKFFVPADSVNASPDAVCGATNPITSAASANALNHDPEPENRAKARTFESVIPHISVFTVSMRIINLTSRLYFKIYSVATAPPSCARPCAMRSCRSSLPSSCSFSSSSTNQGMDLINEQ